MYEPITHINEGDVFEGYQQYFKVLGIWNDEATIMVKAGDSHRVERGPIASMIERLNAALDPDDNHDDYWEHKHPEVRPVAMWPDDCDYEQFILNLYDGRAYEELDDGCACDIETGELYDDVEDGFICDNCFHYADASQMHICPSCNEYVCDKCWNHSYGVCQDCMDEEEENQRQSFNKG